MTTDKQAQRTPRRFACFTMEDGVYESATGEHVSYADYERLSKRHDDLLAALERARGCIKGLLARTPVRDVSETLAEVDAAIAKAEGK